MRKPVELSYRRRINQVIVHIGRNLDTPLDGEVLAEVAAMSRFHFHRVFAAMTSLTPAEYVFLARMSRAAERLRESRDAVTHIALEVGFESGPALAKALRRHFGMSASEIRAAPVDPRLGHLERKAPPQRRQKEPPMNPPDIIDLPEQQVLCATERGRANNDMGPAAQRAFSRLYAGAKEMDVLARVTRAIALSPDPPRGPDDAEQRFVAGYVLEGVMPSIAEGLHRETIAAGRWAVFRHVGPYTTLWQTWTSAYRDWAPRSGCRLRHAAPFEHYVNEPTDVPPEQLITDIYVPVE